jgi:8-oxo-dGTP pyrophosphatase MutT (NUDIX family)
MPTPDFVVQLRRHVGKDLLWLPSVSGVVVNPDGEILLGRRADDGRWSVISGIVELDEQPATAVVREVLEETGVRVVAERLASVWAHTHVYPNGDRCRYLNMAFRCRPLSGTARVNDDESLAVGWFGTDRLPELDRHSRLVIEQALAPRSDAWFQADGAVGP